MGFGKLSWRRWLRLTAIVAVFYALLLWETRYLRTPAEQSLPLLTQDLREDYPLLWTHVHSHKGEGGAWYIPDDWLDEKDDPKTIVEAAQIASRAAKTLPHRRIPHSQIPLIMHQTWKSRHIETWAPTIRQNVEEWLMEAVREGEEMAYFFWEDGGLEELVEVYEPDKIEDFVSLVPVSQSDVFRIAVTKWIGGIYADVDTKPLRSPAEWLDPSDLRPWTDPQTNKTYESSETVNFIWGIECDTDPKTLHYWRAGYSYPVQLTQWALASAPDHPIASIVMDNYHAQVQRVRDTYGDLQNPRAEKVIKKIDPLRLAGPPAVTMATKGWLENTTGLRWNALTGLQDGGRSKMVSDVVILPITGFSPGRVLNPMGSKPIVDVDARLFHEFRGTWKHFDLLREIRKVGKTIAGHCIDWFTWATY